VGVECWGVVVWVLMIGLSDMVRELLSGGPAFRE
jgi:hypothetical protein